LPQRHGCIDVAEGFLCCPIIDGLKVCFRLVSSSAGAGIPEACVDVSAVSSFE
jgi:hypothetical protein